VPPGFPAGLAAIPDPAPSVRSVRWAEDGSGAVVTTFSEAVMNVTSLTLRLQKDNGRTHDCSSVGPPLPGALLTNAAGDVWTFVPRTAPITGAVYCVTVTSGVYDLAGQSLPQPVRRPLDFAEAPGRRVVSAPK
jgi:hypothetical protein